MCIFHGLLENKLISVNQRLLKKMTEAKGKCKKQLKVNTVAQHVGRRPMEGGCDDSRFSGCDTRMCLLLLSRGSRVRLCATP